LRAELEPNNRGPRTAFGVHVCERVPSLPSYSRVACLRWGSGARVLVAMLHGPRASRVPMCCVLRCLFVIVEGGGICAFYRCRLSFMQCSQSIGGGLGVQRERTGLSWDSSAEVLSSTYDERGGGDDWPWRRYGGRRPSGKDKKALALLWPEGRVIKRYFALQYCNTCRILDSELRDRRGSKAVFRFQLGVLA